MAGNQTCSVCAVEAVRVAIDAGLARKIKLRVLAAQSGLSKSAIHRHKQRCCDRRTLNSYRDKSSKATPHARLLLQDEGALYVMWDPQDPAGASPRVPLAEGDVLPTDRILGLRYREHAIINRKVRPMRSGPGAA